MFSFNQGWGAGAGAGRSQVFLAPWSRNRSRLKKNEEPEQEPEPLGKKIRSRSRLKKSREPEPLKNLPAPQPWQKPSENVYFFYSQKKFLLERAKTSEIYCISNSLVSRSQDRYINWVNIILIYHLFMFFFVMRFQVI